MDIEEIRDVIASAAEISRQNSAAIHELQISQTNAAEISRQNSAAIHELQISQTNAAEISRQNSAAIHELQISQAETSRLWAEGQKRWDEGLLEIKRLREEMRDQREEMREELLTSRKEMREELLASRQESDRIWTALYAEMRGLRRDVGQLGNKLGLYTEAMFFPSLDRILRQDFGMQVVEPRVHVKTPNGEEIEIDVLAHANDTIDLVFDVEIKSHLRQDGIDQILDHLQRLEHFFPEHKGKKAYGILGAIEIPAEIKAKALKAGIYVASIRDDVFELLRPENFEPRAFPI